jgi:fumarylpyruvate hydrolase
VLRLDEGGGRRDVRHSSGRVGRPTEDDRVTAAAETLLFAPQPQPSVAVVGTAARFPVGRIFCVGRNYADHAKEMGVEVDREAPFYFLKHAGAIVPSGATVPYPPGTDNFHYEMEFVVAIGAPAFGVSVEKAMDVVYGYACGLDMTRRDLQLSARAKQRPWDFGKDFERSAVITPILPKAGFAEIGPQRITLAVNGAVKQDAHLSDLVWSVAELVSHLSRYYHLVPGDLIYTGTPAGVGPVVAGDHVTGSIDGLPPIELTIAPAETM